MVRFDSHLWQSRVYNEALTPEEINKVAQVEDPTPTPEPTATPTPPARVNAYGEVHIHTPDGLIYGFQEVGEFVLTQSASGDVVLQSQQESWVNNPQVSINTAVAMNVAGDKLEFYLKPQRLFINDVRTDLPSNRLELPEGGSITINPSRSASRQDLTILWPDGNTGARVVLYSDSHIDIGIARLNGSLTYEGVLGNLDNNPHNDMQLRNGNQLPSSFSFDQLKSFGDSWRVSANESLFRDAVPTSEAVAPLTLSELDPADRTEAKNRTQASATDLSRAWNRNCRIIYTGTYANL